MAAAFNQIPQPIVEQAIAWHLQMNNASVESGERVKLDAWLKQDAVHQVAYQRVENLLQPFEHIDATAAKRSIDSVLQAERKLVKRKQLSAVALGVALFIALSVSLPMQSVNVLLADNKTAIGEIKTLVLADNSRIIMNTNTALDVVYNKNQRTIKLYQGEVFLEVSKDATRPFKVVTEHGDARALGTQYLVSVQSESMDVSVIESSVEACNTPVFFNFKELNRSTRQCVTLHPNQGANVSKQKVSAASEIDASAIAGWVSGSAVYNNRPLPQVLTDLQRYSPKTIVYDSIELQQINISGVLPVNDIPHAISILSQQFDLTINQSNADEIIISAQQ